MFHLGDIVEEIETKRQGKLESSRNVEGQPVLWWGVNFSDGKEPIKAQIKTEALRLIKCPHDEPTESRFVPSRPIMG